MAEQKISTIGGYKPKIWSLDNSDLIAEYANNVIVVNKTKSPIYMEKMLICEREILYRMSKTERGMGR